LPIECECGDLSLKSNRLALELGATIYDCADETPLKLRRLNTVHRQARQPIRLGGVRKFRSRLRLGGTRLLIANEQDAAAAMFGEVLGQVCACLCIWCGCGEEREWDQRQITRLHAIKCRESHTHDAHPGNGARH